MNIVRALDVALPELPQQLVRKSPPKLDPRVIAKEHVEKGKSLVLVKMPGSELVFRFVPLQWQLIQLFDGNRTHAEVAAAFEQQTGTMVAEEDVQELASFLQTESQLFYRTATEQSITLQQELRSSRKKRSRFHGLDFADVTIKTWHNADGYISWLYPKLRFLFTPWFVWSSIGMFILMGWMWADKFGEVWADSFAFFNFTQKSGSDLLEFWFLFGAMAAIHETAHGLVGKHFGATIEKMGFTLMYFAPSFFCDATQVWVIGGKWARIATAIAGIWLDLVVCFFATVVWWTTPTGMLAHDWAYKIMMITGLGVSILNLNPLIKLDGYLIFSELVAEPSLKESSTAYLSGWVRKHIFHLPAEVPYVPRRKRAFFAIYGVLSGLYSYSLLSFLMVITYNILHSFTPEWAFIPAVAIGAWVFSSRIKMAVAFMKMLYLDKKERVRSRFTPGRTLLVSGAGLLLLFLPVWPDAIHGTFVLTPVRTAVLRATVPSTVESVAVWEGESVSRGTHLLQLRNTAIDSDAALAQSELKRANANANQAAIQYKDYAGAEQERRRRSQDAALSQERQDQLAVNAPIAGVVATAHVSDLVGRSVDEGDTLLAIDDSSQLRAKVYVPEFAMHDVHLGQTVKLLARGQFKILQGRITDLSEASTEANELASKEALQGINPPHFYVATILLENDGKLRPGAIGSAKVVLARKSLGELGLRFGRDLAQRKIW